VATIGTINVDLLANTAAFQQEMGRAADSMGKVSKGAEGSGRALKLLLDRGIGAIVPEAHGAGRAIETLIDKVGKLKGAFGVLGQASLFAGAFAFGVALGNILREQIDNWRLFGETIKQTIERIKQEAEEQQKFSEKRAASVQMLMQLEGELAQSRSKASSASQKGLLGESTVGSLQADMSATIDAIDQRQKLEEAAARKLFGTATENRANLNRALLASEQKANSDRYIAAQTYYQASGKLEDDALQKSKTKFEAETTAMFDSLNRRLNLRKQLEAQVETMIASGAVFDPGRQAEQTKKAFDEQVSAFVLLLDKGRRWSDLEEQIFRKEQEFQAQGQGGFAQSVKDRAVRIGELTGTMDSLGISTANLTTSAENLDKKLRTIPEALVAAGVNVDAVREKFNQLELQFLRTAKAANTLANVIVAGGPPPVTAAAPETGGGTAP
jgi:hypothetical protein